MVGVSASPRHFYLHVLLVLTLFLGVFVPGATTSK